MTFDPMVAFVQKHINPEYPSQMNPDRISHSKNERLFERLHERLSVGNFESIQKSLVLHDYNIHEELLIIILANPFEKVLSENFNFYDLYCLFYHMGSLLEQNEFIVPKIQPVHLKQLQSDISDFRKWFQENYPKGCGHGIHETNRHMLNAKFKLTSLIEIIESRYSYD